MGMKNIADSIFGVILAAVMMVAASAASGASKVTPALRDSVDDRGLTVSFLTCEPGPEIYELCGHEAIRVRGEGIDSVWNYGTFDFREPNFVYRFVKGETDYMLQGYPTEWFIPEYVARGSRVTEQDINLTREEARRFLRLLRKESEPANCRYRYNYVRDNCATRITERLEDAVGSETIYPDSVKYKTFREAMRYYHRNYPWYQFGIDMVLGRGLDIPVTAREGMFVPMVMERNIQKARFADGRPVVKARRVIYEGRGDVTLPPTPWLLSPLAVSLLIFIVSAVLAGVGFRSGRFCRWWWSLVFGCYGLIGCLVAFLVFGSAHEATSPNLMLLLFNPFQLLFAVSVWFRKLRAVNMTMGLYNIFGIGTLMLIWPFQSQSANPAFWPLAATAVVLGGACCFFIYRDNSAKPSGKRTGRITSKNKNQTATKRK